MFQEYVLFCFLLLLFIETQRFINKSYMNVTLKCIIYVFMFSPQASNL